MLTLFIILVIMIMILFFPVPLKIYIVYKDKKLYINFFKINLLNKKNFNLKSKRSNKNLLYTIKKSTKLIKYISNIKSKPKIDIKINFNYGFEDAATTAIFYGIFNSSIILIIKVFSALFKIRKYKATIIPNFNKQCLKIEITSIIHISFAKIIYVIILLIVENSKLRRSISTSRI